MNRPIHRRSTERTLWLHETSIALEEAERILAMLAAQRRSAEAPTLMLRIQTVRAELESFNRVDLVESRLVDAVWPVVDAAGYTPSGNCPPPPNGSRNGSIGGACQPAVAQNPRLRKAFLP